MQEEKVSKHLPARPHARTERSNKIRILTYLYARTHARTNARTHAYLDSLQLLSKIMCVSDLRYDGEALAIVSSLPVIECSRFERLRAEASVHDCTKVCETLEGSRFVRLRAEASVQHCTKVCETYRNLDRHTHLLLIVVITFFSSG